ncbi:glycerate 2-kinase [Halobacillus andaensis]|uniref:Glycerate 2-kinase n=1 Tax=Halobacillus andaensis TaxID=1176239 RepID=A0A917B303_HALAA|nr:glycerate kinase [Halobacillus andaensis]MBP2004897.1 glycerate kinase [Halobacillus andaensis]GGF18037.1 glycerate 2-kinase [Halobacillus andaensis]
MNVVFAPDSYKGSLSSIEVSTIMSKAFQSVEPEVTPIIKPMADGGEGTLEALTQATAHEKVTLSCTGPLGERSESWYISLGDSRAVIEGANIAGLPLVPHEKQNPDATTTYGLGEAIRHALDRGERDLIIAIGGSSTNDGGLGMLQALGMKAYTADGKEAGMFGKDLLTVKKVDFSGLDARLNEATIRIACDVDNPLTGPRGASYVYGPQKGASKQQTADYDQALEAYGQLVEKELDKELAEVPGAGAAGGLGFAFLAMGAHLQSGARLVAEAVDLEEAIKQADLVLTGEGQSDEQTVYGKAPGYVAELARLHEKPVILLSGSLGEDLDELNELFTGCFSILQRPSTLEECIQQAEHNLYQTARQIARLIIK